MRERLFRGKRKDTGEWIEGNLVHQTEHYGDPVDRYHILYTGEFDCDFYDAEEVIPETVGQDTGLTDNEGTKIFEGDVVSYKDDYGVVIFKDGSYIVKFDTLNAFLAFMIHRVKVIGNIHDNPELNI